MIRKIILSYKKTHALLSASSSGRKKLNLILSFVMEYEKIFNSSPPFVLFKDFLYYLIDVILKGDINFIGPDKLNAAKHLLNESRKEFSHSKGGDLILVQIEKAIDILNMQLLKIYFYIGKYEDGLAVLNSILKDKENYYNPPPASETVQPKEINQLPSAGFPGKSGKTGQPLKYSLVNPEIYKETKAYEILTEIKNEFERLNSFSDSIINILLVEHESKESGFSGGIIQNLLCSTSKKKSYTEEPVEFENITDFEDSELELTFKKISMSANAEIKNLSGKTPGTHLKRNLRFQNIKGVYKGSSLGLGAAVICTCNYFSFSNNRIRYSISNAAAFTGSVDETGRVLKVSSESIKDKIEAAFFSWVKYCFVPKEKLNEAVKACEELRRQYPTKEIYVIGVENISEVFENNDVVKKEVLSLYDFTRLHIEKHKIISAVSLLALVIIATVFLSKNFLPKDIKPLPKTESEMYLIYTPDGAGGPEKETGWIFKNADYYGGDTINFGDVAIGDQWYPLLEFWNNAREKEEFKIFIEGEDKDEFQITYLYKNEQPEAPPVIAPDISQPIYVKFVPTKSEGKKSAELVFENNETKLRKTIYLKGGAKRYNNGYCIKFDQKDDNLVLEPNTNLVKSGTSISFWMKPYWRDSSLYSNIIQIDNNPLSKNKLQLACEGYNRLVLHITGNKSNELLGTGLKIGPGLNMNEWNFIAFSLTDSTVSFVLNDTDTLMYFPKNSLRIINDYIFWGMTRPDDKNGLETFTLHLKYYLDEFKIYNKNISSKDFIENRYNTDFGKEHLLAGYNFEDATPKRIYDQSPNDFWPRLYGGIARTIDTTQPFKNSVQRLAGSGQEHSGQQETSGNTVFSSTYGFSRLNKDLFGKKSSFTLQCDVKAEKFIKHNLKDIIPVPFFINRPGLDILYAGFSDTIRIWVLNIYNGSSVIEYYKFEHPSEWNRYTITYDIERSDMCFYINNRLVRNFENIFLQDIAQNYMGISFGIQNYFGATRFFQNVPYNIDNIRIYNRPLLSNELYSDSRKGLLADWDFENTDKELAYDNVSGLPLLMIEPFEFVKEEVEWKR